MYHCYVWWCTSSVQVKFSTYCNQSLVLKPSSWRYAMEIVCWLDVAIFWLIYCWVKTVSRNKAVLEMVKSHAPFCLRTRHMGIKLFFTKQYVDNGKYCPSDSRLADMMTKALTGITFLNMRDPPPQSTWLVIAPRTLCTLRECWRKQYTINFIMLFIS